MVSKKLLSVVTALILLTGVLGTASARTINPASSNDNTGAVQVSYAGPDFSTGGPTDLVIANEEKIIEMLKKQGKIAKNATYQQAQKVYLKYMQGKAKENNLYQPSKLDRDLKAKQNLLIERYKFKPTTPDTNPKKVNILVLLVDYSDYKHNCIQPGETDMYYKDYTKEHYQDMLFGDSGYAGPKGENLISMKQYYAQQSGGSLDIEGTVAGWYALPKTAAYYGAATATSNDIRPRNAVADALKEAAKDPTLNLNDFDKEDIYDIDEDGDLNEPDGIIDYLMVLHAGVGEEAGGGSLGSDAIWSHSWDLGGIYTIPGTSTDVPYWGGRLGAYHYTIEPEDGATGVFAHEFGHNLGVPDEYDTIYSSAAGEPISYWSIMSSGSWGGTIPGAEPTGFSPYGRQIFEALYGGNWQNQITLDFNKLSKAGAAVTLKQADQGGQVVRINLPDRAHALNIPTSGTQEYWGGKGMDGTPILTNMTTGLDLTGKTSAALNFKTWYDIEEGWDYATVQVREAGTTDWEYLSGNITTTTGNPDREVIVPYGITGSSDGKWVDASFDLSAFAGKNIELKLEYATDSYTFGAGFYVDDINVVADGGTVFSDDAEAETSPFTLNGFKKSTGTEYAVNYYLVEWRNQHGVDRGLAHVSTLGQSIPYSPGMVVWYVDEYYTDNWTGVHPGEGYIGIVDADQIDMLWNYRDFRTPSMYASNKYQMRDAAFSMKMESLFRVNYTDQNGVRTVMDTHLLMEPKFSDKTNYLNAKIPQIGRDIPKLGLSIQILFQALDNSSATIIIKK